MPIKIRKPVHSVPVSKQIVFLQRETRPKTKHCMFNLFCDPVSLNDKGDLVDTVQIVH